MARRVPPVPVHPDIREGPMASSAAQLFVPYVNVAHGPWIVRRQHTIVGRFASQAEALQAAERMAPSLSDHLGRPVQLHVQHADGTWEEHNWVVAGLVA
jgi:hypothetical protein